ncbi:MULTISPECIES: anthranilate synthase component I family protein [Psychrobacter]|uniref:anthranilate synthase component I family protein n=1 Tax=Psychrobacter TaxID=497 RepID=UPI000C32E6CF|nr:MULTISPECIES: anthranilate synthase component I family protein [Psychrobacter]PKG36139.1 aminodeoxychorismate synthase component I [Psychrobacter sp. Sarcosine-3u-12]
MPVKNHKDTEQTVSALSPATQPSWRFGGLTAAELLPLLQQYLIAQQAEANWQLVWLNNDGRSVIGLLPKVSWSVYGCAENTPDSNEQAALYQVRKTCRDAVHNDITVTYRSYNDWQDELISYSQTYDANNENPEPVSDLNEKPSYHHGLIGFIGYDIAAHELSPAAHIELATQPCAILGHYDIYLTPSDKENGWRLNTLGLNTASEATDATLSALISYLDTLEHQLSSRNKPSHDNKPPLAPLILNERWHKNDYQRAFAKTQEYLQQGDCYQINLTQAWHGCLAHNDNHNSSKLIDYLPALHRNTKAPFAGYLQISHLDREGHANKGESDFELLSCSPELFFTFTKETNTSKHHIRTKPIKGTMPRGLNTAQDNAYKQQLIDSEKDRAENVMIVDLLRNDLGKYAKIGSVKVPQLFAIETFSNVHHMVSTITAELKADTHPLAVLFGSLPAGSITGAPKKRAVEIISELETAPRGAYCGTMGYMNFDGSGQWNVLIRTLQATNSLNGDRQVSLWAGGGITVASDCDAEYQECLDKVGNLLSVLADNSASKWY